MGEATFISSNGTLVDMSEENLNITEEQEIVYSNSLIDFYFNILDLFNVFSKSYIDTIKIICKRFTNILPESVSNKHTVTVETQSLDTEGKDRFIIDNDKITIYTKVNDKYFEDDIILSDIVFALAEYLTNKRLETFDSDNYILTNLFLIHYYNRLTEFLNMGEVLKDAFHYKSISLEKYIDSFIRVQESQFKVSVVHYIASFSLENEYFNTVNDRGRLKNDARYMKKLCDKIINDIQINKDILAEFNSYLDKLWLDKKESLQQCIL